jgi:hypothetical protein
MEIRVRLCVHCTYQSMHVYACACVWWCVYDIYMHVDTSGENAVICTHTHSHKDTYKHTYIYSCTRTPTYICVTTYKGKCMNRKRYKQTNKEIHTNTHTKRTLSKPGRAPPAISGATAAHFSSERVPFLTFPYHLFFTWLSVRPGNSLAISAHRDPNFW